MIFVHVLALSVQVSLVGFCTRVSVCGNPRKLPYTTDKGDQSLLFPFTVVVIITLPDLHLPFATAPINSSPLLQLLLLRRRRRQKHH